MRLQPPNRKIIAKEGGGYPLKRLLQNLADGRAYQVRSPCQILSLWLYKCGLIVPKSPKLVFSPAGLREAQTMPVLILLSGPKMGFSPRRGDMFPDKHEIWHGGAVHPQCQISRLSGQKIEMEYRTLNFRHCEFYSHDIPRPNRNRKPARKFTMSSYSLPETYTRNIRYHIACCMRDAFETRTDFLVPDFGADFW